MGLSFACLLAIGVAACAAPVMHPRTADVLNAHHLRLRASTVLFAMAPSTAVLDSADETLTASGEYRDLWTARQYRTRWVLLDSIAGLPVSIEAQAAYSLFDGCEGGAMLGLIRIGAELRCGVLDEDRGAPLSAALSIGAAQQISRVVAQVISRGGGKLNPFPRGQELRAGLDLSKRLGGVTPLLNVNIGYVRQWREVQSGLPGGFEGDHFADNPGDIPVERDELRLSIPVGFALESDPQSGERVQRVMLGVVPEITLKAWQRWSEYEEVPGSVVLDLKQHWALYYAIRDGAGYGEMFTA